MRRRGITVNGVAPALIGATKMLPEDSQELAKSKPSTSRARGSEMRTRVPLEHNEKITLAFTSSPPLTQLMLTPAQEYRWVSLVDLTRSLKRWFGW